MRGQGLRCLRALGSPTPSRPPRQIGEVPCHFFLCLYFSGIILHWSLFLGNQNNIYDLSITIAANFQSDSVLFSSSFSRRRPVKKRISCNKCNKECHFWSTLILWCIKISSAYFNLICCTTDTPNALIDRFSYVWLPNMAIVLYIIARKNNSWNISSFYSKCVTKNPGTIDW